MSNCSSFCNSSLGLSRLVALAKISKSPFTSKASGSIVELSHVLRIRDDRSIKDAGLDQDFFPNFKLKIPWNISLTKTQLSVETWHSRQNSQNWCKRYKRVSMDNFGYIHLSNSLSAMYSWMENCLIHVLMIKRIHWHKMSLKLTNIVFLCERIQSILMLNANPLQLAVFWQFGNFLKFHIGQRLYEGQLSRHHGTIKVCV